MDGWRKKRGVMLRYDTTATIYDSRYAEEQEAKYRAALQRLGYSRFGFTLDVGCGTGLLFRHIVKKADFIVGLDISKKALLEAANRIKNNPRAHLVHGDADWLPFKEGIFDHVFAMTFIQNMPNPAISLGEMERVSRRHAVFVVTGLKKIFRKKVFMELLRDVGLKVETMTDEENIKCYVAKCSRLHRRNP